MINGITFDLRNVSAKDDARVREKTLSNGILHGCALTHSGKNLTIGMGHFMVAGREIEVSQAETVASDTTEANGYGRLRFVIDLSVEASETVFTQYRWEWDYQAENAAWPALVQEDINGSGEEYEIAFAIVSFSSGNISATTLMGNVTGASGLLVTGLSLPTSGYSGSGPYTIDITATGASTDASKRYLLIPDWSSTAATRALEKTAWNLIDDYEISAADTLTITATAVPATAVGFSLKEVV